MVYYAPACTPLTHLLHAAPPLPGRDRSRSRCTRDHMCPPVAHVTMVPLTSGPDRRLPGLYRTIVGSSSTCSLRAFQRYQPRAVHRSSWPPAFESRVQNHVRPPLLTSTLCPDHGTSERFCTHPACAACGPSTSASHPHRPSPDGAASAPPARAHPCAALLRSRGCCTRLRCGLATPGIVRDLHRRDVYVRDGVVATLPCTSCISSARRRELVAAGR